MTRAAQVLRSSNEAIQELNDVTDLFLGTYKLFLKDSGLQKFLQENDTEIRGMPHIYDIVDTGKPYASGEIASPDMFAKVRGQVGVEKGRVVVVWAAEVNDKEYSKTYNSFKL